MNHQKLILHVGTLKTGSTALQNYLSSHKNELEESKIIYQSDSLDRIDSITSGNGTSLATLIIQNKIEEAELLLKNQLKQGFVTVVSSESICQLSRIQMGKIMEICNFHGVGLQIVVCIRNVIPYLISLYDQLIKRHGEWRPFEEWIIDANWVYSQLENLMSIFCSYKIHSIHYDSHQRDIIAPFLSILGINHQSPGFKKNSYRNINRSLTGSERALLCKINKVLGAEMSTKLSDALIYGNPKVRSEPVALSKELEEMLVQKFQPQVDWVNQEFFNRKKVITVLPKPEGSKNRASSLGSEIPENDPKDIIIDVLANKINSEIIDVRSLARQELSKKLLNSYHDARRYGSDVLPEDFDVIAYALKNQDLIIHDVNLVDHYINHGHAEGRSYRIE